MLLGSLRSLKAWILQSPSRVKKIAECKGTPGTRAAPTQLSTNDKRIGSRLDNGEKIIKNGKEYKRYKFQINKSADNPTRKQLPNKDSHKVWSQADIPIGEGSPEEVVKQLFEGLEANIED
ncbi:hypothetical protein MMC11_006651 [Xylographa trunciseda]|nr:hypothetical protein [Xylographa trunciseda]